jgi:hypothetical protein
MEQASDATSQVTKKNSVFTSPAGAIIAIICFFLPWVKISCGPFSSNASGLDIGGILWLSFICAIGILVIFYIFFRQNRIEDAKPGALIFSIGGLIVIIGSYFVETGKTGISPSIEDLSDFLAVGAYGTIIGFIIAFIGSFFLKKGAWVTEKTVMTTGAQSQINISKMLSTINKIIAAFDNGRVIRKTVFVVFRVFGFLSIAGGIYLVYKILDIIFSHGVPAEVVLGGLLFTVIIIAAVVVIFQIWNYRSNSIKMLEESQFVVTPIFSIFIRTIGEIYATLGTAIAIGGTLLIWLGGNISYISYLIGRFSLGGTIISSSSSFLVGLIYLVTTEVITFLVLAILYFIAEIVVALVDIAKNIRILTLNSK